MSIDRRGHLPWKAQRLEAIAWGERLHDAIRQDRGASVELRRLLTGAPVPTRAYWQLQPPPWVWPRELPMWLAGLAARLPRSLVLPGGEPHPESCLRQAHQRIARTASGSAPAFERRFTKLLTCHPEDLHREIVPVVELASRVGVRLHYGLLLADLAGWDSADRRVQRRWAQGFWAPDKLADAESKDERE